LDIKDFILIGGGLLIAAVIAHGFWIAWRARRESLRIDIRPDLIPDTMDDLERLRGELPSGGARLVGGAGRIVEAEQESLTLEPPAGPPGGIGRAAAAAQPELDELSTDPRLATQREPRTEPTLDGEEARPTVAEVTLPEPELVTEKPVKSAAKTDKPARRLVGRRNPERKSAERVSEKAAPAETTPVAEELIVMNVIAAPGTVFTGEAIFAILRGRGLKFGDMNIFHRTEPLTRAIHYSVANVVEPGTFDMADMDAFRTPGMCFFMQLPGPEHPAEAFEDMLSVAREVEAKLGGELSDEQRNRMTNQTVGHYRQRIADFSRRRMSKRA
jgi:cell division protein ZipA